MSKMLRMTTPSEHASQVSVIQWWDSFAKTKGLDPRLLWAMPNAAKRSYKLAAYLHAEGLRPGVPDLFLAVPSDVFHGMFVEMKSKTGKVEVSQREYHGLLRAKDYTVVTCFGSDEAIVAITAYVGRV